MTMTKTKRGRIESISEAIGLVLDGANPDSVGDILLEHQKELLEALATDPENVVAQWLRIDPSDAYSKAHAERHGGPAAGGEQRSAFVVPAAAAVRPKYEVIRIQLRSIRNPGYREPRLHGESASSGIG